MKNNRKTKKEGRGWPFSGGCSFDMKNKLKSEIFNGKKIYKKMLFSVMTKNLSWAGKLQLRWDGVNIMGVHWKIRFLGGIGGVHEKKFFSGGGEGGIA